MNIISAYLKKWLLAAAAALGCMALLTSCDSVIFDDEGDCSVTYRLKFRYDRNMKWADAFTNEVKTVRLYAFSKNTGTLAWQQMVEAADIAAEGMTLDLPAGDYTLLAWCTGVEDGTATAADAYTIPAAKVNTTRIDDLTCRLSRGEGGECALQLPALFHGRMDVTLPESEFDGGEFFWTMDLTKDTNHVRIILQHLSGEPVNPDDFTFTIEEENGLLGADNDRLPDEPIVYSPYHTASGLTEMTTPEDYYDKTITRSTTAPAATRGVTISSVSMAIADLNVSRLMADSKALLTIKADDGDDTGITRLSLTEYALLLMDGYNRRFTGPQDYLDRQDEYALVFFLDENDKWIATSIIINSWKVVINNASLN